MSLFSEIKQHKFRTLKTLVLYLVFVGLALPNALVGPCLLDLRIAVGASLKEITYLIPAQTVGFIVGSTLCAFIIEVIDSQIVLIVSLLASVGTTIYIPLNRSFLSICINQIVAGTMFGLLDTGGNVWLIHLWGKENPPFMQGLHFAFGLGSFIAPLIASPFLLPVIEEEISVTQLNITLSGPNATLNATTAVTLNYGPDDVQIFYPFLIAAIYCFVVALIFTGVYCVKPSNKEHPSRTESSKEPRKSGQTCKVAVVIALVAFTMFFYFGLELGFGQLLTTYAAEGTLKLPKVTGSYMTSVFWGTFTFGRCFTIFVVDYIGSQNLILGDLILVVISTVIIVPFGSTYEWSLWVTAALMGTGLSSMFAAFFGFLEEFTKVTSKITSLITISSAAGSFVVPYLVGNYIETNPVVFPLITLVCSLSMSVIFVFLVCFKKSFKQS